MIKYEAVKGGRVKSGTVKFKHKRDARKKSSRICRIMNKVLTWPKNKYNSENGRMPVFFSVNASSGLWVHYIHSRVKQEKKQHWNYYEADMGRGRASYFTGVRSVRAFRRRLRQWNRYLPAIIKEPVKFTLSGRFMGFGVYGFIHPVKSLRS